MSEHQEGTILGVYRIISQVGKGGMATVYKAHQISMGRDVALKVLPKIHAQDPNFTERFIQEARTIAQLEHRNILPVYDFGEEDGVTFMAMRYLNSGTLQDILSLGELSFSNAVSLMRQICAGLDYAHRQGVIHRDVKPANVMVDNEGTVYITDFGLAKVLEHSSELTASGTIMGTPFYMAPEQSVGTKVDGRSDIYSAGVILYEMVTGKRPFDAETPMAVVLAHLHDPLPLPQEINPGVPMDMQRIIVKAMSKEPDDRYQTAKEMSDDLAEVMEQLKIDANAKTLRFLSSEIREKLASQTILPTDANFTPVPTSTKMKIPVGKTLPSSLSSKKSIYSGVLALVLAVIILFFGISYFEKDKKNPPSSLAQLTAPLLYDDFSGAKINSSLWQKEVDSACNIQQKKGELIITNDLVDYEIDDCDLVIMQPEEIAYSALETLETKILFYGEYEGDSAGQSLMYQAEFENGDYWYALCGAELADEELVASFWVALVKANGSVNEINYASVDIEPDTWHTYRMESLPGTDSVACFVNNKLVGKTAFEIDNLEDILFVRGLTAWRGVNTIATTKVDDYWLIP